ncbi:MAG TPA: hypothetical protein VF487_18995 [Chitinophagaceae bacterium]
MLPVIKYHKSLLLFLFFQAAATVFGQPTSDKNDSIKAHDFLEKEELFKRNHLGIEITASVLPKATIQKEEGKYELKSHLQSSYDLGINYLHSINKSLSVSVGLHFVVGKRNFFANIPSEDINNLNGQNFIEEKELWGAVRIPLLLEKNIYTKKAKQISVKTGINFRYSGLMPDEDYGQGTGVFNAQLSARNNGKPWITFLAGISKSMILDNKNILAVTLQADISTTYFLKANYELTIPNQPVSTGIYKINGTSLGLTVQYIFTGSNKQFVQLKKTYKAHGRLDNKPQLKRESILKDYVFKGNHIQFNFAFLSTLKARIKNISGNHPVSASAAQGLSLSFKYQKNYNNEYSLIIGPEATLTGRNFNTSFSKDDFSPPLASDYNTKQYSLLQDLILSLPVLLEKRWLYSDTKFFFADAGGRINFSLGADIDIYSIFVNTSNGFYNAGGVDVYSNNDAKPWISFPLNIGHSWLCKNNNLLQLAICSNISFVKYVNGTYWIDIPGKPLTTGNYSSTGSYVGLSMNYVFTNANYRIRKKIETN